VLSTRDTFTYKDISRAGYQWIIPVILATWEGEIGRNAV
jgi:hypothetical protein